MLDHVSGTEYLSHGSVQGGKDDADGKAKKKRRRDFDGLGGGGRSDGADQKGAYKKGSSSHAGSKSSASGKGGTASGKGRGGSQKSDRSHAPRKART